MSNLIRVKFDMFLEPFLENLLIYTENLSYFFFTCALVSFFAVWYTWNIPSATHKEEAGQDQNSSENFFSEDSDESLHSNVNTAVDKKLLIKSMENALTKDDWMKESDIEKKQLMDILEIMKKDEKFKLTTMEELREQLKLYRE